MVYLACAMLAVLLALSAIQVQRIITGYRAATGTPWQRFLSAFSHSQTVLLARFGTFASALLVFGINFLPYMDPADPFGQQLQKLIPPQYAPVYMLLFSLAVEYVRKRPGSTDPIVPPQVVMVPPPPAVETVQ